MQRCLISFCSPVNRCRFAIALSLVWLAQTVSVAQAQTTSTWIGGTSGNWFDETNWSTGVVPNDDPFNPTTDVEIDGDNNVDATVSLADAGETVVRSLSIGAGDSLLLENGFFGAPQLRVLGSNSINDPNILSNQGVISLVTDSTSLVSLELANNTSLSGGGEINLTNSELLFGPIFVTNDVTNVDNQIQGSGVIVLTGVDSFTNSASGLISANQDGGLLRIRDTFADVDFINGGTLRAENGGVLSFHIDVANTGGVIEALDDSTVVLERGASITGGVLRTTGSGTVELSSNTVSPLNVIQPSEASLRDLTIDANVNLEGTTLNLQGTIDNRQTITTVEANSFSDPDTTITINGEVNLTGGGTIDLDETELGSNDFSNPGTLTNTDNTIQGSGDISVDIVNEAGGLIVANRTNQELFIGRLGSREVTNRGTLRAENGGVLIVSGGSDPGVVNEGVIEALDNSRVSVGTVTGGTLRGVGSGFVNFREISDLTLEGSIDVLFESALAGEIDNRGTLELGGQSGSNSSLVIKGGVSLSGGGTVLLSSLGFFEPEITDSLLFSGPPASGPDVLTNIDNTITGAGVIGSNALQVINEADGIIEANGGELDLFQFSIFNTQLVNRGTLRAAADSSLVLGDTDNTSGVIEAGAGGQVDLTFSSTTGGTLRTVGDGVLRIGGDGFGGVARISDATVNGNIEFVGSGARIELENIGTNGQDLNFTAAPLLSSAQHQINFVGDTVLDGSGTIRLASDQITIRDLPSSDAGDLSNASTIEGFGGIVFQAQDFVNESNGLINANVDQRELSLFVGSPDNEVINRGVLRASNGGELTIFGDPNSNFSGLDPTGFLDNTGGRIEASAGSVVNLIFGAEVVGGEIVGEAGSRLVVVNDPIPFEDDAAIQNVTLDIATEVIEQARFRLEGQIDNRQTISVTDSSSVVIRADTTLSGGGTIQLGNGSGSLENNTISSSNNTGSAQFNTLTNLDNTIQGSGNVGVFGESLNLVNEASGVIQANVLNETLIIEAALTNRGLLRGSNGGTLALNEAFFDFNNDGIIEVQDGIVEGSSTLINGVDGTLRGNGTIDFFSIVNEGTISPGLTPGTLTLDGFVNLTSTSVLEIELFGTQDGEFDLLEVTSSFDLGGLLSVDLEGFTPTFDDEFRVATAAFGFFGDFDNVALGERLRSNDGQFDFLVSIDDSTGTPSLLLSDFQVVSVPEPGSAALIGLAFLAGMTRRRRCS